MLNPDPAKQPEVVEEEWVAFPGGELEGQAAKVRCQTCRERRPRADAHRPLCFQCYRAHLDRVRALKAAAQLDTGSNERLEAALPFEPVNRPRLGRLRAERLAERAAMERGVGRCVGQRRRAQIAARHALREAAAGLHARGAPKSAIHSAELQWPEAWLPFVLSR